MPWGTDTAALAVAVAEFEAALPGWWWSVGQCSVGAHASAGVDSNGEQAHLLLQSGFDHPFDAVHADTVGGTPAEALRAVMALALDAMAGGGG